MLQARCNRRRAKGTIHLPRDYSPGIQFGLVAMTASRSRPDPKGPRGRLREADGGLPLGELRSCLHGRCCAWRPCRRGPRQGPSPAWAETRRPGARVRGLVIPDHPTIFVPRTRARPRPLWPRGAQILQAGGIRSERRGWRRRMRMRMRTRMCTDGLLFGAAPSQIGSIRR